MRITWEVHDDSWKAQAFLNFYIPTKDGRSVKLGTIALKTSDPIQAKVIALLQSKGVDALDGKLEMNFQNANAKEGIELDL